MLQRKPILAVDLDEVLGQFVDSVCKWHNRLYKTSMHPSSFRSYHFSAAVPEFGDQDTTARKIEEFLEGPASDTNVPGPSAEFLSILPVPGSRAALEALSAEFELHVVTARSDRIAPATRTWLSEHFGSLFTSVTFTNAYKNGVETKQITKGTVCRDMGAVCLIDDNVGYSLEASEHIPLALLFGAYSWNTRAAGSGEWEHALGATPDVGSGAGAGASAAPSDGASMAPPGTVLRNNVLRARDWTHVRALLSRLLAALRAGEAPRGSSGFDSVSVRTLYIPAASLAPADAARAVLDALLLQERLRVRVPTGSRQSLVECLVAGGAVVASDTDETFDVLRTDALLAQLVAR